MKLNWHAKDITLLLLTLVVVAFGGWAWQRYMDKRAGWTHFSVEDRLRQYDPTAGARVKAFFDAAGLQYPPARLALLAFKTEKKLQVYAPDPAGQFRYVHEYPILAASGEVGPKLKEGDGQVPEGIYKIESLNPNSLYHLALRVGYPNEWDMAQARKEGRTDLGEDIMIHGASGSVGCLAMGDPVSEDLFVLAAHTGIENISLLIFPVDFRMRDLPRPMPSVPPWTPQLYGTLRVALAQFHEPMEAR